MTDYIGIAEELEATYEPSPVADKAIAALREAHAKIESLQEAVRQESAKRHEADSKRQAAEHALTNRTEEMIRMEKELRVEKDTRKAAQEAFAASRGLQMKIAHDKTIDSFVANVIIPAHGGEE